MTTKHTPGPWTIYEEEDAPWTSIWIDAVVGQDCCRPLSLTVAKLEDYDRTAMRANAALIKASPSMHAALKAVLEDVGAVRDMDPHTLQVVKDALTEAGGTE